MAVKVALITGAAQGIGRATALRLARQGHQVAVVDLQEDKAQSVVEELRELGSDGMAYGLDVSDGSAVRESVDDALKHFGRIDVLVNNAGTHVECDIADISEETYDRIYNVVMRGTFLYTHATLPSMVERKSGNIVNISSVWAWGVGAGAAPYGSAKAGVVAFTKAVAQEVGKHGIRVNSVAPGLIDTPMYETLNEEQRQALIDSCPLGRLASPDEIAGPVAFLISDEASWMTGETITVSGGTYLR